MKKKIQKPFDAEAAKRGARVETRSGRSVRIICYNKKGRYPIVALVAYGDDETYFNYNVEGKYIRDRCSDDDLVIVEEVGCPKFNVGDWIVREYENPWLITTVTSDYYEAQDVRGYKAHLYHSFADNSYHLWTLDDAKPGDVLISEDDKRPFIFKEDYGGAPSAYCGVDTTDSIYIATDGPWTRPATSNEKDVLFKKMEEEGYKWDADSLTLSEIQKRWRDNESAKIDGYFVSNDSQITNHSGRNIFINHNVFATEKQAKSAIAMARISQIMANDERFGGGIIDEEWDTDEKYVILRIGTELEITTRYCYEYLAFHTKEQAELFLKENEDLIKMYYMMD